MSNYKNLEIWQLARKLVIDIHKMTLEKLPQFELYEQASQVRRSSKSIKSTIVEGYGRRRYKQEFIRYLTYSQSSCDETLDHLETLFETGSLTDEAVYRDLHTRTDELGRKINKFTQAVERRHRSGNGQIDVKNGNIQHPGSSSRHREAAVDPSKNIS